MPELRHLRAFLAVAQARNFTRAAASLHVAQQAVSRSVSQLEGELGVRLLERTTREVSLTDAGSALAEDAQRVVAAADAAFARARALGDGRAGRVTIGLTPSVGVRVAAGLLRPMRTEAPDVSLSVRDLRPGEVRPALRERRVDVVLARTVRDPGGLRVVALEPTPAMLVVPAGHRLAGGDAVDLGAIDGERLLTWSPPGTPFTERLLAMCAAAGARVTPVESPVTGIGVADLAPLGAVALVGAGVILDPEAVAVPLRGDVTLPLVAVLRDEPPSPAVARLLGHWPRG